MVSYARQAAVNRQAVRPEDWNVPSWAHPDVIYAYTDWMAIRHCAAGEKEVKAEGKHYLPMMEGMSRDEYRAYLERATFFNFTGRTIGALVGTLFQRAYQIRGVPERFNELVFESPTKAGQSLDTFIRYAATEFLTLGRLGVLVDMPAEVTTTPRPYLTAYTAENIVDWDVGQVKGRTVLTTVVLREFYHIADPKTSARVPRARYRRLQLVNGVYQQHVFTVADPSLTAPPDLSGPHDVIIPKVRGAALDYIPFYIFGPHGNVPDVFRAPMIDIASLNISHYQSSAHLEHARFYVGMPIYYAEVDAEGSAEYKLGPSVVWEVPKGSKAGIIEFNGQGLKHLENALDQKVEMASALGGRMMGVRGQATSESDNQLKLKERNEQVHLLTATVALDAGILQLLKWLIKFGGGNDRDIADLEVILNKAFLFDGIGSREFRAILSMYKDGVLPVTVVYHYLQKAEVIPDWMDLEEFKKLINDMSEFPNQPDIEARREGFASAQARQSKEIADDQLDFQYDELDAEVEKAEKALEDAKATREAAAKRPVAAPGQPGQPGQRPAPNPRQPQ